MPVIKVNNNKLSSQNNIQDDMNKSKVTFMLFHKYGYLFYQSMSLFFTRMIWKMFSLCFDRRYVHHYQSNIGLCQNCLQSVDTCKIHSLLCLRYASKWKSTYIINNHWQFCFLCIFVFTQFLWNLSGKGKCINSKDINAHWEFFFNLSIVKNKGFKATF